MKLEITEQDIPFKAYEDFNHFHVICMRTNVVQHMMEDARSQNKTNTAPANAAVWVSDDCDTRRHHKGRDSHPDT